MKTHIARFIPGVALSIAVLALGAFVAHAQQSSPAAAPQVQAVAQPQQQVIICGVCGARIGQPAAVLVAPGVYAQPQANCQPAGYAVGLVQGFDGSYYFTDGRIPPAPVFSLTDYWRADPRLIVPQRRFVNSGVPVRHFRR